MGKDDDKQTMNTEALKLAEELLAANAYDKMAVARLRKRLQLKPMADILAVLDKVLPAEPIARRARRLKVARQTYYSWLSGRQRPNKKPAKILSKLTGIPVEDIRGYKE